MQIGNAWQTHIDNNDFAVEAIDIDGYYAAPGSDSTDAQPAQSDPAGQSDQAGQSEESISDYPTLIYDGPFSDGRRTDQLLALARESFLREQMHVPSLPIESAEDALRDAVANTVRNGIGVAAEESGRLQGFMAFYGPIDNLFGDAKGAISPIHAHAVTGERRDRLYSWLFQHVADAVVGTLSLAALPTLSADPVAKVRGAWANTTDSLVDAGLVIAPAWTDRRIASSAAPLAPTVPHEMRHLAAIATMVTFGPTDDGWRVVDDAISTSRAIDEAIRADRTRWQRLRWRLSLRSLRRATRSPVR